MRVFLDIPPNTPLDEAAAELGCEVEQLLTPLTRYLPHHPDRPFAIDNGGYSGLRVKEFRALLKREYPRRELCRWVAVPDVVGSARRTLELFDHWHGELHGHWPLAFVAQDGQGELPIPWSEITAVFIGGTTDFKMSVEVEQIIQCAKGMGKWVHVGRVNTPGRFEHFESLGVDSIDGTGLAKYTWMRQNIYDAIHKPKLFAGEAI